MQGEIPGNHRKKITWPLSSKKIFPESETEGKDERIIAGHKKGEQLPGRKEEKDWVKSALRLPQSLTLDGKTVILGKEIDLEKKGAIRDL